jgi:hypothetical protein
MTPYTLILNKRLLQNKVYFVSIEVSWFYGIESDIPVLRPQFVRWRKCSL